MRIALTISHESVCLSLSAVELQTAYGDPNKVLLKQVKQRWFGIAFLGGSPSCLVSKI